MIERACLHRQEEVLGLEQEEVLDLEQEQKLHAGDDRLVEGQWRAAHQQEALKMEVVAMLQV
jgi:hypothetical protein